MAGLEIAISLIMIFARWQSMTVLRYVEEAPLQSLTANIVDLLNKKTNQALVREVDRLPAAIYRVSNLSVQRQPDPSQAPRLVRNDRSMIHHRVQVKLPRKGRTH